MNDPISITQLADEIRQIYLSGNGQPQANIEAFVDSALGDKSAADKIEVLQEIVAEFDREATKTHRDADMSEEILSRIFSLVLGGNVRPKDLSSEELLERLANSLNTIFDTLNHLVKLINLTLHGNQQSQETIRHVIGYQVEGTDSRQSLETYLGQISNAFLVAHRAFQKATEKLIGRVLDELDPSQLSKNEKAGFKFRTQRKAELFETYELKYKRCRQWYSSDRFQKDILREFEKRVGKMIAK
jgi:hypothetical protein